jgi:hypothetical protein
MCEYRNFFALPVSITNLTPSDIKKEQLAQHSLVYPFELILALPIVSEV